MLAQILLRRLGHLQTYRPDKGLQLARIQWVDTAKGLGIVLVVVGHVERGLVHSHIIEETWASRFVDAWIYSFHMPLFFFLSGLFLFRSATKSTFLNYAHDKFRTIVYPYFVWSALVVALKSSLGELPNSPRPLSDVLMIPIVPMEQFWFLYVLSIVAIFFGALFAVGIKPWVAVILAALLHPSITPYFLDFSGPLNEARAAGIYVAVGALTGQVQVRVYAKRSIFLCIAATLGLAIPALVIWSGNDEQLHMVLAISGTAGVIALSILINGTGAVDRFIRFLGRNTLEIYVSHTIFSAAIRIALCHVSLTNAAVQAPLGVIVGLAGPLILVAIFKQMNFRFGFTFPSFSQPSEPARA